MRRKAMNASLIINESLLCSKSIVFFITDQDFRIKVINNMATDIFGIEKLEEIIDVFQISSNYFCILSMKCEVEVIREEKLYIFLLHPKQDLFHLYRELEQAENDRLEIDQIMNSSYDGIVITAADGTILYQNPAYEQFTGMSVQHFIGKKTTDFVENGLIDETLTPMIVKEKKPLSIIQTFFSTGKKALISGVPIKDKNGNITKIVANTRDLTILNKLEKEIQELKLKNQKMMAEKEKHSLNENPLNSLVAQDEKMKMVIERTLRVAQVDSTVLIQGESGVGKEGLVRLIHQSSNRNNKPLVQINCGAIPEQLLESELFGYESGSFTGANSKGKQGLFESANGGTIFLDEIGEMPLHLQVKLLRVLQEFEITRIGGVKPIKIDVRVITATHRNLEEMVAKGQFREDLYYRLKIIPIFIPPLRERKDDIIPLVYHFLHQIKNKYGIERTFSEEALISFQNHNWPGNVRELQNMIERISLMVNKPIIDITEIRNEIGIGIGLTTGNDIKKTAKRAKESIDIQPLKVKLEEYERDLIQQALTQFSSMRKAAKALGVDQSTLVRKKQKYQL
jgi:PAS domain S-box-containing protein